MSQKITPCLWYDGTAEEAANLYISIFKDGKVNSISRSPSDNPSVKEGAVLTVSFELFGQRFVGLNGGPTFKFTEATSFMVECADQAEVDTYWDALTADGGQESQCGWLKDKFGMSWQIIPKALGDYLGGEDAEGAKRAMQAMLQMSKLDVQKLKDAYEGTQ